MPPSARGHPSIRRRRRRTEICKRPYCKYSPNYYVQACASAAKGSYFYCSCTMLATSLPPCLTFMASCMSQSLSWRACSTCRYAKSMLPIALRSGEHLLLMSGHLASLSPSSHPQAPRACIDRCRDRMIDKQDRQPVSAEMAGVLGHNFACVRS